MKQGDLIYRASEKKRLSFGLALLTHVVLVLLLFFGVHWQNPPAEPLEIEMWGEVPASVQRAGREQESVVESTVSPVDVPTPAEIAPQMSDAVVKPEIIVEKKPDKKQEALKPQKLPLAEKKQPEEKPKEVKIKPIAAKKPNRSLDLENLLKGAKNDNKQGAAIGSAQGGAEGIAGAVKGGRGGALDGYLSQLKQQVRSKTIYSEVGSANPSAVLKIFVLPDGTIRDVQIVSFTGDIGFANARKQALLVLQRLPPLPPQMSFSQEREWTLRTRLRE
jgi:colicin import membrane protein